MANKLKLESPRQPAGRTIALFERAGWRIAANAAATSRHRRPRDRVHVVARRRCTLRRARPLDAGLTGNDWSRKTRPTSSTSPASPTLRSAASASSGCSPCRGLALPKARRPRRQDHRHRAGRVHQTLLRRTQHPRQGRVQLGATEVKPPPSPTPSSRSPRPAPACAPTACASSRR